MRISDWSSDVCSSDLIDGEGRVTNGPLVPIDTSQGKPSELCWLQITSDNSLVLATNFGYGTVSTYRLAEGRLSLLQDPANQAIPGDGTFLAVNGLVSRGPSDRWLPQIGRETGKERG